MTIISCYTPCYTYLGDMASLYKRTNSKIWWARVRSTDGLWQCISTGIKRSKDVASKVAALEFANDYEKAAQIAYRRELSEAHATELISKLTEISTGSPLQTYTVATWLKYWLETKKEGRAETTYERYSKIAEDFIIFLGKRATMPLTALRVEDVEKFKAAELQSGKAGTSVNVELKALRAAFNTAKRRGYITSNPAEGCETAPNDGETKHVFTRTEIDALLETTKEQKEWKTAILLGLFTGMRLQDVLKIKWSNLDFTAHTATVTPQKQARNKKARTIVVPLPDQVENAILELPTTGKEPDAYVLPTLAKMKSGGANGASSRFNRIMEAAGIDRVELRPKQNTDPDGKSETKSKGRRICGKSFHSLRHTAVSALANAGIPEDVRMRLVGHENIEVNRRYTKQDVEVLRKAQAKLLSGLKK
jgi:integrase